MNGNDTEPKQNSTDINTIPTSPYTEGRKASLKEAKAAEEQNLIVTKKTKKKRSSIKSIVNFLYNPRKKTVLGRSSLNWAKLALFYTVFYFCLGCFFVILLTGFYLVLDKQEPRYFNEESTMAVRTTATVVGMGFRPQPTIENNLIEVSNDPNQQKLIASSLRLFRDVYLLQKTDGRTAGCSDEHTAADLDRGVACAFNWHDIVDSQTHPCSDNNLYGFKNEQPCILVKLNKVYGWIPKSGKLPTIIQELRGISKDRIVSDSDVYITCGGTNPVDRDILINMTYYSVETPTGSSKFGIIPNYFFPYRNAPDHVQPFVLVQFNNLPINRLISITCRAWAPGIEHDTRGMRGMVTFQLYRRNFNIQSNDDQ